MKNAFLKCFYVYKMNINSLPKRVFAFCKNENRSRNVVFQNSYFWDFHVLTMNFVCFPYWKCDLLGCRSRACLVDGAFKSLCLALSKREIKSGSWSSGFREKCYLSHVTRNFRFSKFFLVGLIESRSVNYTNGCNMLFSLANVFCCFL